MKEERRKKKLIKNKPFSTVLFFPPSPGSHLAKELRMIVEGVDSKGGGKSRDQVGPSAAWAERAGRLQAR